MNTPDSDAKLYIRYLNKGDDEAIGELYERYMVVEAMQKRKK